jgi:hypothetical protein
LTCNYSIGLSEFFSSECSFGWIFDWSCIFWLSDSSYSLLECSLEVSSGLSVNFCSDCFFSLECPFSWLFDWSCIFWLSDSYFSLLECSLEVSSGLSVNFCSDCWFGRLLNWLSDCPFPLSECCVEAFSSLSVDVSSDSSLFGWLFDWSSIFWLSGCFQTTLVQLTCVVLIHLFCCLCPR